MNQLLEFYNNLYRRDDIRREFNILIQKSRFFIEFYSNYIRIKTILKKFNRDLLNELLERLRSTLRNAFQIFKIYISLRFVKKYLLKLNN